MYGRQDFVLVRGEPGEDGARVSGGNSLSEQPLLKIRSAGRERRESGRRSSWHELHLLSTLLTWFILQAREDKFITLKLYFICSSLEVPHVCSPALKTSFTKAY